MNLNKELHFNYKGTGLIYALKPMLFFGALAMIVIWTLLGVHT